MNKLTLEEFLIEHTKINKKFIRDFFGIQNKDKYKKHSPFIVNLDIVSKWLKSRKDNLKDTLVKSYNKDYDYIIFKVLDNQDFGGHKNKDIILLTTDCFKRLCMLSKSKNAEKVRDYYIALEHLVDKYKDTLIEAKNKELEVKNKEIDILKHDLKKENKPSGKYVYIFSEKDELGDTYYRIGLTKNLKKRIPNHGTSNAHNKKYIFKIKSSNIYHLENCIKSMLYDHRYKTNKDYYKVNIKLIKEAIKICEKCIIKFKCYDCNEKIKQTNKEFSNHFNENHINDKINEYYFI